MDANIERKLKDYLSQLQTKTSGQNEEEKTISAIQDLTPTETLKEIYSRTWLDNTHVSLGDYFKEDEIPDLIKILFDFCLGSWANQKIVCVGDYSDKLPLGYLSLRILSMTRIMPKAYHYQILLVSIWRISNFTVLT